MRATCALHCLLAQRHPLVLQAAWGAGPLLIAAGSKAHPEHSACR
jgi:hypothetical protein